MYGMEANEITRSVKGRRCDSVQKNNGHSIWVTAVNGDTITYADCNSDRQCKIMWGKTISKSEVAATLTNVYVAPYAATNASSAPTNPTVSKSAFWYDIKDTISLYIHADGATSYYMSLFKDGQKLSELM